jgi:hypothetical protein
MFREKLLVPPHSTLHCRHEPRANGNFSDTTETWIIGTVQWCILLIAVFALLHKLYTLLGELYNSKLEILIPEFDLGVSDYKIIIYNSIEVEIGRYLWLSDSTKCTYSSQIDSSIGIKFD